MAELFTAENLVALLTLTALEIVLGIDNVIFLSILADKLPVEQQSLARRLGIGLAVGSRIVLLLAIGWVVSLTNDFVTIFGTGLSGKDVILLGGGMFLIGKSTYEIHEKLESVEHDKLGTKKTTATLSSVLIQVVIVDLVFSLDSVITAVGISGVMAVMIPAILIAAVIMILAADAVASFVKRHPTMKILALAFLILIGSLLVIEGWNPEAVHDNHLKNYIYFAMAFSFLVELVNLRLRKSDPVKLHNRPETPAS